MGETLHLRSVGRYSDVTYGWKIETAAQISHGAMIDLSSSMGRVFMWIVQDTILDLDTVLSLDGRRSVQISSYCTELYFNEL